MLVENSNQNRRPRGIFSGCLAVTAVVVLVISVFSVFINDRCYRSFRDSIILYPNAVLAREAYPFLSTQVIEYYTPDALTTVMAWWRQEQAARSRQAVVSGDFTNLLTTPFLVELAPDRPGSVIAFSQSCP